jgi:hypothetical protein
MTEEEAKQWRLSISKTLKSLVSIASSPLRDPETVALR